MTNNEPFPLDIVTIAKKQKFFTVVDALPILRVKLCFTEYNENGATNTGHGYLDLARTRVLTHKLLAVSDQLLLLPPAQWPSGPIPILEQFGGGGFDDAVQSRVFKVSFDTNGGKLAAMPFRLELSIAKGIRGPNGAIQPVPNDPTKKTMFVRLSLDEAIMVATSVNSWIQANARTIFQTMAAEKARKQQS